MDLTAACSPSRFLFSPPLSDLCCSIFESSFESATPFRLALSHFLPLARLQKGQRFLCPPIVSDLVIIVMASVCHQHSDDGRYRTLQNLLFFSLLCETATSVFLLATSTSLSFIFSLLMSLCLCRFYVSFLSLKVFIGVSYTAEPPLA